MSAGKHASSEWTITYDDSGGTPRAVTNFILTIGGLKIEAPQQLSHAFGDAWEEYTPTGMRKVPAITLTGFLDDTATTGPHNVMQVAAADIDPNGNTRTLTIVTGNTGSGLTFAGETRLQSYEVIGKLSNLTEFSCVIQPTGAFTWS